MMMVLNSQNRSELSPSKKIFNVSARVFQGFRRYSAWQPQQKTICVVSHQILQPEGDVFGIRHRLLNSSARVCANLVGRATYVNVDSTFLKALVRVRVWCARQLSQNRENVKFLLAIVISAIGLLLSIVPETAIIRRNYTHTPLAGRHLELRGEHVCV